MRTATDTFSLGPAMSWRAKKACLPGFDALVVELTAARDVDLVIPEVESFRIDFSPAARLPNTRVCFPERRASHRLQPAGSVFVIPPGERIRVCSDPGRLSVIMCSLQETYLSSLLGEEFEIDDDMLQAGYDVFDPTLLKLLFRLACEVRDPTVLSEFRIELLATELALSLSRRLSFASKRHYRGGLAPWRLRKIEELIECDGDMPRLSELADICKMSVRHTSRAFRVSKGISIGRYVIARRLQIARHLLARGKDMDLVAGVTGFSSASNLNYSFRKATGMTLGQFRRHFGTRIEHPDLGSRLH